MAYNRENLLKRIIEVQDIVLEYKQKDVPQKRIFEKHIMNRYHISYSTFNEWLGTPSPRTQLKKLLEKKEQQKKIDALQPKLFF